MDGYETLPSVDGAFFARLKRPTHFVLIRHGRSEGNASGIFQGRKEYPLSDIGREQAADVGRSLAAYSDAVMLCSPLSRARETAEIAARMAGLKPPSVREELTELDTGTFTGRSWDEIREKNGEEWIRFRSRSWEGVAGAEREEALYARAIRAWMLLRDTALKTDASCVVAVTHGGFLQWLIRSTFGSRTWFPLVPIENCCVYRLRADPVSDETAAIFWETMGQGF
ncbi:MAG: histidine phosphatase family protein [Treponemataceae bacterium]